MNAVAHTTEAEEQPTAVVWTGGEWVWSAELGDWVYVPILAPVASHERIVNLTENDSQPYRND